MKHKFEVGKEYATDPDGEFNDAVWHWRCVSRSEKYATFEKDGRRDTRTRMLIRQHHDIEFDTEWCYEAGGYLSLSAKDEVK